jgi:hypothetical protein
VGLDSEVYPVIRPEKRDALGPWQSTQKLCRLSQTRQPGSGKFAASFGSNIRVGAGDLGFHLGFSWTSGRLPVPCSLLHCSCRAALADCISQTDGGDTAEEGWVSRQSEPGSALLYW